MNSFPPNPDTLPALGLGVVALLLALNLGTFLAFAVDKRRAGTGAGRVPELSLLTLAALGGWPAAKLAQWLLRHKTRKEPFRSMLNMVALPLVAVAGVVAWQEVDFAAAWTVINTELSARIAPADPAGALDDPTAAVAPLKPDSPDLPQRFGPGASAKKGGAWKSK
jgi:uncharacterized membrane protein YsdA (DUF1294 family)